MIGLAHILMVGFYVSVPWKQILWIGMTGTAMITLVHVRLVKPLNMSKRPYQVSSLWQESDNVWTFEVIPEGHEGIRFKAGQFTWITLDKTPFSLQQHPFTIASGEGDAARYLFTVKELGDMTSTIKDLKKGQRAYLEGPYGAFTLPDNSESGFFFVVGGIGITPVISMLRTMRDKGDRRKVTLLYGNTDIETTIFQDELKELERVLNLSVIYVFEHPPDGWKGYNGYITKEIIRSQMPEDAEYVHYYVCGPEPLMDLTEITLQRNGVPFYRIHSERFNIV